MHIKGYSSGNIPTITIVIPVYDVALFVERCVQSVMGQTYPAAECIIVDDASKDDSIARCQRLIDRYSGPTRFMILHHERNRGLSAARNTGTKASISDYIYYLDSDDEMTPDCLEKLVDPLLRDDTIEMVMGSFRYDYSMMHGKLYQLVQWIRNRLITKSSYLEDAALELLSNEEVRNCFYHGKNTKPIMEWNKLLKLSFLRANNLYNKEGILYEESLWTFYLMRHLGHAVVVPDVTYIYNQRPGSIMTGTEKEERIRHFGYTFREIADRTESGERIEETEWVLWSFCRYYIDGANYSDYQYAYKIFHSQLSDGHHRLLAFYLILTHYMAKSRVVRIMFKWIITGLRWSNYFIRLVF